MASQVTSNGTSATTEGISAAQQLKERHAQETHNPTVEEVVDEEDIAHPPPSALLSAKAAGKQKETAASSGNNRPAVPDTQSEEAFPALGAPKARAPAVAQAWGKKAASLSANGSNAAVNGSVPGTNGSSRASTPGSGGQAPSTPFGVGQRGHNLSLPTRSVERISFHPSQLLPRSQMKQPIPDLLREINRRSRARVVMKEGTEGLVVFEGSGPVDAARQALKEVATQVGAKQSLKVPIPSSVRQHIIGRQGQTIQNITKRTGARVHVPKQEGPYGTADDDDSATVDVVIEGDPISAEMARREVEAIVNERTSTVNLKLKDIPAEYYPFLAGPNNSRISRLEDGRDIRVQIPHYCTRGEVAPQCVAKGQPVSFAPQPDVPIQIAGDRLAAQQAKAEIERHVEELRRQLTMDQLDIERGRHQFIVGDRGSSLHDFLQETGCSVILPPPGDDSETLIIVGPPNQIENGYNKVLDLASSMQMASIDIARQHANQAHARDLARYLKQRQAIADLEKAHNSSIVVPTSQDGPTAWEVFSRDGRNMMRARADIMNLVSGHPPQRLKHVHIDPFYHQHLRHRAAQQVRKDFGVYVVFPETNDENPQILLVYEAPGTPSGYEMPRQKPSAQEIKAFEKALQEATQHLLGLVSGQDEIVSRPVEANPKFHDRVRRYVDRHHQGLPQDQVFPPQLLFGRQQQGQSRPAANEFQVRGPSGAVDALTAKISEFLQQEEKDEVERGHVTTFDYPQKFANFLIGKRGENINKLREDFDVEIQIKDGKVQLTGPPAKANAAKTHIMAFAKKLEDEATFTLRIEPQYHRDLIGAKGSQVNRLQERYNVRVNFPRSGTPKNDDDTDAGSVRNHRDQNPDEVVIKGPRRGAEEARDELLNLLQYLKDHSHTATVSVSQNQIPSLIGTGGREMENLRLTTGAQIDVPSVRDPSGRAEVRVKGTKKQVEDAKKLLQERVKKFDETISRTVDVDKKHHRALIGQGGSNIRNIVVEAGGPDDRREVNRIVRFPRQESDETAIRVEGPQAVVEKIVATLEAYAKQRDSQVSETLNITSDKHRLLIGRGGETRRNLESQFNITLDVPKQGTTGDARNHVKLTGLPSDVETAKEHILNKVKEHEGETVQVPRKHHNAVADNGQFFRRLKNEHKVTVDHNGEQPPPRPAAPASRARINGGASMPLITDDPASSADSFSFEIVDGASSDEPGSIPWVLRGAPDNVARAKALLEQALAAAEKPSATGYLILPDPRAYRLVIGPGGSQINSIRRKTGTRINVPRAEAKGEAIEIVGERDGIEKAKDIIVDLARNGGNGGRK